MWGRKAKSSAPASEAQPPSPLKEAMHLARVEAAERTSVVVDLRDAEVARLELLNEALDPLFAEIAPEVELSAPVLTSSYSVMPRGDGACAKASLG